MQIPFVSLAQEHERLRAAFHAGLDAVLDNESLVLGQAVADFERDFAALCGCRTAVGVGSGADALELGLRALGIAAGDEVIVPANSFFASASAVFCAGGVPVFCDVDEHGLLTAELVNRVATSRTRAVVPVHLYGQCVDMDPLRLWAKENGCALIEDACQAHGATYKGRPAGSLGDLAAFSFYPTKNLGALGDGGAVTTCDSVLGERVRLWRNYGSTTKYVHTLAGRNSRLDTLQAHFLSIKLVTLAHALKQRQKLAAQYLSALSDLPLALPVARDECAHVYHLFVVRTHTEAHRDALRAYLRGRNIATMVHYPVPIHHQEPFRDGKHASLTMAERWSATALSLPLFPTMSSEQCDFVCAAVREHFAMATT